MCRFTLFLSLVNVCLVLWIARRMARLRERASVLRILQARQDQR